MAFFVILRFHIYRFCIRVSDLIRGLHDDVEEICPAAAPEETKEEGGDGLFNWEENCTYRKKQTSYKDVGPTKIKLTTFVDIYM